MMKASGLVTGMMQPESLRAGGAAQAVVPILFYGPQPPLFAKTWKLPDLEQVQSPHEVYRRDTRMRTLVQRLKRLWNTPVEFYGVDRQEPQAGPWHGLMLFVVLLVVLGLLWLIRYLPARTYLVQLPSMSPQGRTAAGEIGGGQRRGDTITSDERGKTADGLARRLARDRPDLLAGEYQDQGASEKMPPRGARYSTNTARGGASYIRSA
jgi:hypothetical protein